MTHPRTWFWIQIGVAVAIVAAGVVGYLLVDWSEYLATLGYLVVYVNAWVFLPALAVSLVINAFVIRAHRDAGPSSAEKVLLVFEGIWILALLAFQIWWPSVFGPGMFLWPLLVIWAIIVVIVAGVRNSSLRRAAARRDVEAAFPGG